MVGPPNTCADTNSGPQVEPFRRAKTGAERQREYAKRRRELETHAAQRVVELEEALVEIGRLLEGRDSALAQRVREIVERGLGPQRGA